MHPAAGPCRRIAAESHIRQRWAAVLVVKPAAGLACLVVIKGDIRKRRIAVSIVVHSTAVIERRVTAEGDVRQREAARCWAETIVHPAAAINTIGKACRNGEAIQQGCAACVGDHMDTIGGIASHGCEVGNDWRLAVVIVDIPTQDGDVGCWVALVASCFCPGETAVNGDPALELECGVAVGSHRGWLMHPCCHPDFIAAGCAG